MKLLAPWAYVAALLAAAALAQAPAPAPAAAPVSPQVDAAALKSAANAALNQGHKRQAARRLQQALKADPKWVKGWWEMGTLLYEGNQYPAAAVAYARLTRLVPRAGAPWVMLGLCDFEMRNFGLSLQHITEGRALGLPPDKNLQAVAIYHQIQDLLVMGNFVQAGFILRNFAHAHQAFPGAILAAGLAALHYPLPTENLSAMLDPARMRLVRRVGEAEFLAAERKIDLARRRMAVIVKQYPRVPYLHYAYADILRNAGKKAQSELELQSELQVNPKSATTILQLAADKLEDNRKAEALALVKRAGALRPHDYVVYYMLALIRFRSGHPHAALQAARQSRILNPENSQIRYLLAQIDIRLHRAAAARREQRAFLRLRKISSVYMTQGVLPAFVYTQPASPAPAAASHP